LKSTEKEEEEMEVAEEILYPSVQSASKTPYNDSKRS
jgi:hypothetical protein